MLLFSPFTVLSQSVLLGLQFIHNSVFPSHPPFALTETFVKLFDYYLCSLYIYHDQNLFQADHYFIPLYLYVFLRLIIYIMVLYGTRSQSFIRFRECDTAVLPPNKRSGTEVQPLAALYPTVTLSPWGQVQKNIHFRVWTPGPT